MRVSLRSITSLLAAATAAVLAAPAAETLDRRAALPNPYDDPFYTTPSNIGTFAKGQVIQSRKVPTDIGNANNAASFQLQYRTTNTQNEAVADVATVWIPAKPASPPKIFSYQVYEDATALDCAPSYSYLTGFDQPNKATAVLDTPIIIGWALQQGYYVVSSDHEGFKAAFIAGYEEGMAILDGIRALKNYQNLPSDSKVALEGYSGGAHATVWATSLAESYAPELNIVGASHGGTPVSAKDTFTFLNGGPFAGFALAGVSGLSLAHPDMESFIEARLNAKGQQTLKQIRGRGFCLPQVVLTYPFLNVFSLVNDTNLLNEAPIAGILKQETVVQAEASYTVSVPKFPRFIWHAIPDEIVPYQPAATYVKEQCSKGANINFSPYPIAEHLTAEIFGLVPSLWFIKQAFDGTTPKVICGTPIPAIAGITTPSADQVLGSDLANQLRSLNGKQSAFGKPFGPITPP